VEQRLGCRIAPSHRPLRGEEPLGGFDIDERVLTEPEEPRAAPGGRFASCRVELPKPALVRDNREDPQALDAEASMRSALAPPGVIPTVFLFHPAGADRASVDLDEEPGPYAIDLNEGERVGDERNTPGLSGKKEVGYIRDPGAGGLEALEIERTLAGEEFENDAEGVAFEVVREGEGGSFPSGGSLGVAFDPCEFARAKPGQGIRRSRSLHLEAWVR
jgi:hypothetical protein